MAQMRWNAFFDPDELPLDAIVEMSSDLMRKVIQSMNPERKELLLAEVEERIIQCNAAAQRPGLMYADEKGPTRFPHPYTMVKKYTYIYTVMAGWFSAEDLRQREEEKRVREVQAFADKNGFTFKEAEDYLYKLWLEQQAKLIQEGMTK